MSSARCHTTFNIFTLSTNIAPQVRIKEERASAASLPKPWDGAVRNISLQIPQLPSLENFVSEVKSTLLRLLEQEDLPGKEHHDKSMALNGWLHSVEEDCKKVHDAASLLEEIKSNTWAVDEAINDSLYQARESEAAKSVFNCFYPTSQAQIFASKLTSDKGQIYDMSLGLWGARLRLQSPRKGTIDHETDHRVSFAKSSTLGQSAYAEHVVFCLSSHSREALLGSIPKTDQTLAQKNRVMTLKALSNPCSTACDDMRDAFTGLQSTIDPDHPPPPPMHDEMRHFGSDMIKAKNALNAKLREATEVPGVDSVEAKKAMTSADTLPFEYSLDSTRGLDLPTIYAQSFDKFVTGAGSCYPPQVLEACRHITGTARQTEQTEEECISEKNRRVLQVKALSARKMCGQNRKAYEAWRTCVQSTMFPDTETVDPDI
jgi:hypothetical protein